MGDGVDKIIVLHTPPQTVNNPILIYKLETNPQPGLSLYGTHHCRSKSDLTSMTLVRPYITALLPATNTVGQTEEQTQINVVSISLYRNSDGKHILVFSTHCYIGGERHESTDPWNECHNSQQEDPLYDIGDAYRHIKWLRCSVDKSPNGLMEIFSLYGVLGVRVFAPTNNKEGVGLYEWVGQTPYLGQTAIGAGRGSHVDWGHGFQTWGNNEDFIDVNTWIPEVGTEERQGPGTLGAWGMTPGDIGRSLRRGWEVEKTKYIW